MPFPQVWLVFYICTICFAIFSTSLLQVRISAHNNHDIYIISNHAIIVPLRKREHDAKIFMHHMIHYFDDNFLNDFFTVVFVIQADQKLFNRGFLFNIGFNEVVTRRSYTKCIIFHDVDLIPVSSNVPYNQCLFPIQLGSELEHHNWTVPYQTYCGGVVSMSVKHWKTVNGFSNRYHGWGGEDDDLYERLRRSKLLKGENEKLILRPPLGKGIYNHTERTHLLPVDNAMKQNHSSYRKSIKILKRMIRGRRSTWQTDGINSVKYIILSHKQKLFDTSRISNIEIFHVQQVN
jgi:N-terminal domain of galactosyltransferase/N-terminal region of glycosyl transferase group 7